MSMEDHFQKDMQREKRRTLIFRSVVKRVPCERGQEVVVREEGTTPGKSEQYESREKVFKKEA